MLFPDSPSALPLGIVCPKTRVDVVRGTRFCRSWLLSVYCQGAVGYRAWSRVMLHVPQDDLTNDRRDQHDFFPIRFQALLFSHVGVAADMSMCKTTKRHAIANHPFKCILSWQCSYRSVFTCLVRFSYFIFTGMWHSNQFYRHLCLSVL